MEAHECAGDFSYRIEESVDGNFSLDYGHFDRIGSFSLFRASVLVSFNSCLLYTSDAADEL